MSRRRRFRRDRKPTVFAAKPQPAGRGGAPKGHEMIKRMVLGGLLLAWGLTSLPSQSNELFDRILAEQELRYGSAVYLMLSANYATQERDAFDRPAALRHARERIPVATDRPLTLGQYAYLLQQFFELPRGIWYRVYPTPRAAARDLAHAGIIQGRAYPNMRLSGERAVRILGRSLAYLEGNL